MKDKIAILVASQQISGAEKRAINIFEDLRLDDSFEFEIWMPQEVKNKVLERFPDVAKNTIFINKSQWEKSLLEIHKVLSRGDRHSAVKKMKEKFRINKLSSFVKKLISKSHTKKLNDLCKFRSISLLHVFLDVEYSGGVRDNCRCIFEVTSPDWSKTIVEEWSEEKRNNFSCYKAVSEGVHSKIVNVINEDKLYLTKQPYTRENEFLLDFEEKENIVVFAHRFIERKNGLLFAEAANAFLKKNKDWKIFLLGSGEEEGKIKAVLEHDISIENVFVGHVPDIKKHLKKSKIFVSLIEPDNYPSQSVLEALSYGNSLLISDTGYSVEKFIDDNGVVININKTNYHDVCSKLEVLVNSSRLENMCKNSVALYKKKFSNESYISELKSFYLGILNR